MQRGHHAHPSTSTHTTVVVANPAPHPVVHPSHHPVVAVHSHPSGFFHHPPCNPHQPNQHQHVPSNTHGHR